MCGVVWLPLEQHFLRELGLAIISDEGLADSACEGD